MDPFYQEAAATYPIFGGAVSISNFVAFLRPVYDNVLSPLTAMTIFQKTTTGKTLSKPQFIEAMRNVGKSKFFRVEKPLEAFLITGLPSLTKSGGTAAEILCKLPVLNVLQVFKPALQQLFTAFVNSEFDTVCDWPEVAKRSMKMTMEGMVEFAKATAICPDLLPLEKFQEAIEVLCAIAGELLDSGSGTEEKDATVKALKEEKRDDDVGQLVSTICRHLNLQPGGAEEDLMETQSTMLKTAGADIAKRISELAEEADMMPETPRELIECDSDVAEMLEKLEGLLEKDVDDDTKDRAASLLKSKSEKRQRPAGLLPPTLIRDQVDPPAVPLDKVSHLINAGICYHNNSQYDLAVASFEEAHSIWKTEAEVEGVPPQGEVYIRNAIGSVLLSRGEDSEALSSFLAAKAVSTNLREEDPLTAVCYSNAGIVSYHLGRYDLCLRSLLHCRVLRETFLGHEHVDTAATYNNLGCVLLATHNAVEAMWFFRKASTVFSRVLGPSHPRTSTALQNMTRTRAVPARGEREGGAIRTSRLAGAIGMNFREDAEFIIPSSRFAIQAANEPMFGAVKKKKKGKGVKKGRKKKKK